MPLSLLSLKVEDSSFDENFGLEDPMGSAHKVLECSFCTAKIT